MMIFLACILTIVIETPFLWLCGLRGRDAVTLVVCVNTATNITLNLLINLVFLGVGSWIYLMEAAVVMVEYAIYAAYFGRSRPLFFKTLAANCLSYGLGLLII